MGGQWEAHPGVVHQGGDFSKHVVGYPRSTPLVIMGTPMLEGSSPEVGRAVVKEEMQGRSS